MGMKGNALGAIISIVASILSNIGTNIQKEAHKRNEQKPPPRPPYIKSCLWWVGLVGVVVGAIGDFVAFSLASQELVVAVGCAAVLTSNIVVSMFWHKERMGWTDIVGITCVLGGAVIFALAAPQSEDYTAEELADMFKRTTFVVLLVVMVASLIILPSTISSSRVYALRIKFQYRCFRHLFVRYDKLVRQNAILTEHVCLVDARLHMLEREMQLGRDRESGLLDQKPDEESRMVDGDDRPEWARGSAFLLKEEKIVDEIDQQDNRDWDSFIYAACSGTAGGMMAVFAGCSSKALKQTFEGDNQFNSGWTYVFIFGLLFFIFVQTHMLNRAMMLGDLMAVVPTFQAFWIVFGALSGMALYGNNEGMSWPGLLLMVIGVVALLQHPRLMAGVDVLRAKEYCALMLTRCGCDPTVCGLEELTNEPEAPLADGPSDECTPTDAPVRGSRPCAASTPDSPYLAAQARSSALRGSIGVEVPPGVRGVESINSQNPFASGNSSMD